MPVPPEVTPGLLGEVVQKSIVQVDAGLVRDADQHEQNIGHLVGQGSREIRRFSARLERLLARRPREQPPKLTDFLNLGNGNYVAAMRAPVSLECKAVGDMRLERFELACVGIDIGERILTRDIDAHPLAPSDTLLLAGKREALRRFATQG